MHRSLTAAALAGGLALTALPARPAAAQDAPDLSGRWTLNRAASDDLEAKVKAAAGSQYMGGAPSWGSFTIFAWGSKFSEGQRVQLREVLLAGLPVLERLQIEQSADEVKTIHGDDAVRIFNLRRESAGTAMLTGEKVKRRARWKGAQLHLESSSGKLSTTEVLTLDAGRGQVTEIFKVEMDLLEHPLELKLVYDRARP